MMEHTFKKGDRVFGQICTSGVKTPGTFEKFAKNRKDCIVRRDDGQSGIGPGLYWYASHLTTHDRDFHIGDWVRYEGVHSFALTEIEGRTGEVLAVNPDTIYVDFPQYEKKGTHWRVENLVKIAPPAWENMESVWKRKAENCKVYECSVGGQPETVTIEHDQWGRVEGATGGHILKRWTCNGAYYFACDGWREVKPKRWVPVDIEIQNEGKKLVAWVNGPAETYPRNFNLDKGYRWKTVEIEREEEG